MIADMTRMMVRAMIIAPIIKSITGGGGIMGLLGGGAEAGGIAEAAPLLLAANGAAFSGGKVTAFANGGIVSSPTMFPMANGMGLMGENGHEAVMPLTRDSTGKLGVKSMSSGGGSQPITINVNNEGAADGYQAVATTKNNDGGIQIDVLIQKAMIQDIRSNGQVSQALSNSFGLRRSA